MPHKILKIISLLLCFLLIFEQAGFAQVAGEINLSAHLNALRNSFVQEKFRPLHLRYLAYDTLQNNFHLLLDKGDLKNLNKPLVAESAKTLLNYFLIGITLPNNSFWVNLRPDAADNIIDDYLGRTDVGRILLEADVQLKKDTARYTSPECMEGKTYWNKLYKKAEELFGYENITIPTLTRPWIVPNEIIIRETKDNAYIYKATLKVMLEQDYLKDSTTYSFSDPRLKALNEYSSQLIRELIIPKITQEVNTSKRYAPLRQVFYSFILAQWFKQRFYGRGGLYSSLINKEDLTGLTSKEPWSEMTYFKQYQKSFKDGEYNVKEPIYTPMGQSVRSYFSGGVDLGSLPVLPSGPSVSGKEKPSSLSLSGGGSLYVFSGKRELLANHDNIGAESDPATGEMQIEGDLPAEATPVTSETIAPTVPSSRPPRTTNFFQKVAFVAVAVLVLTIAPLWGQQANTNANVQTSASVAVLNANKGIINSLTLINDMNSRLYDNMVQLKGERIVVSKAAVKNWIELEVAPYGQTKSEAYTLSHFMILGVYNQLYKIEPGVKFVFGDNWGVLEDAIQHSLKNDDYYDLTDVFEMAINLANQKLVEYEAYVKQATSTPAAQYLNKRFKDTRFLDHENALADTNLVRIEQSLRLVPKEHLKIVRQVIFSITKGRAYGHAGNYGIELVLGELLDNFDKKMLAGIPFSFEERLNQVLLHEIGHRVQDALMNQPGQEAIKGKWLILSRATGAQEEEVAGELFANDYAAMVKGGAVTDTLTHGLVRGSLDVRSNTQEREAFFRKYIFKKSSIPKSKNKHMSEVERNKDYFPRLIEKTRQEDIVKASAAVWGLADMTFSHSPYARKAFNALLSLGVSEQLIWEIRRETMKALGNIVIYNDSYASEAFSFLSETAKKEDYDEERPFKGTEALWALLLITETDSPYAHESFNIWLDKAKKSAENSKSWISRGQEDIKYRVERIFANNDSDSPKEFQELVNRANQRENKNTARLAVWALEYIAASNSPYASRASDALRRVKQPGAGPAAPNANRGFSGPAGEVSTGNLEYFGQLADVVINSRALEGVIKVKGNQINISERAVTIEGKEIAIKIIDTPQTDYASCSLDGKTVYVNLNKIRGILGNTNLKDRILSDAVARILIHDVTEALALQSGYTKADAHHAGMMAEAMHPANSQRIRDALRDILKERDKHSIDYTEYKARLDNELNELIKDWKEEHRAMVLKAAQALTDLVQGRLKDKGWDQYNYVLWHDYTHAINNTIEMLKALNKIKKENPNIPEESLFLAALAGILHDTGYYKKDAKFGAIKFEHEQRSKEFAREWGRENGLSEKQINLICLMISATEASTVPQYWDSLQESVNRLLNNTATIQDRVLIEPILGAQVLAPGDLKLVLGCIYGARLLGALDIWDTRLDAVARMAALRREFMEDRDRLMYYLHISDVEVADFRAKSKDMEFLKTQAREKGVSEDKFREGVEELLKLAIAPSAAKQVAGTDGFYTFYADPRVKALLGEGNWEQWISQEARDNLQLTKAVVAEAANKKEAEGKLTETDIAEILAHERYRIISHLGDLFVGPQDIPQDILEQYSRQLIVLLRDKVDSIVSASVYALAKLFRSNRSLPADILKDASGGLVALLKNNNLRGLSRSSSALGVIYAFKMLLSSNRDLSPDIVEQASMVFIELLYDKDTELKEKARIALDDLFFVSKRDIPQDTLQKITREFITLLKDSEVDIDDRYKVASYLNFLFKGGRLSIPEKVASIIRIAAEGADSKVNTLKKLLKEFGLKIAISVWEVASIHAAKSYISSMGLDENTAVILYGVESSQNEARKQFTGYQVEERASSDSARDGIIVEFHDKSPSHPIRNALSIPYSPFKYGLPDPIDAQTVGRIKQTLNIGNRQVIVVGSPSQKELEKIMGAYDALYGSIPAGERPLLVIAPRYREGVQRIDLASLLGAHSVKERNANSLPFEDMSGHNVLILNTIGELLTIYAVADVCIVGNDRNILEPASQARPVLYCQGDWVNNIEANKAMVEAGAALEFNQDNLSVILASSSKRSDMGNLGLGVVRDFKNNRIPKETEEAASVLLPYVLAVASSKAFEQADVSLAAGVAKPQGAEVDKANPSVDVALRAVQQQAKLLVAQIMLKWTAIKKAVEEIRANPDNILEAKANWDIIRKETNNIKVITNKEVRETSGLSGDVGKALKALAGALNHILNNRLGIFIGRADLAIMAGNAAAQKKCIDVIYPEVARVDTILTGFLNIKKLVFEPYERDYILIIDEEGKDVVSPPDSSAEGAIKGEEPIIASKSPAERITNQSQIDLEIQQQNMAALKQEGFLDSEIAISKIAETIIRILNINDETEKDLLIKILKDVEDKAPLQQEIISGHIKEYGTNYIAILEKREDRVKKINGFSLVNKGLRKILQEGNLNLAERKNIRLVADRINMIIGASARLIDPFLGPGGSSIFESPSRKIEEAGKLIAVGRGEEAAAILSDAIAELQGALDGVPAGSDLHNQAQIYLKTAQSLLEQAREGAVISIFGKPTVLSQTAAEAAKEFNPLNRVSQCVDASRQIKAELDKQGIPNQEREIFIPHDASKETEIGDPTTSHTILEVIFNGVVWVIDTQLYQFTLPDRNKLVLPEDFVAQYVYTAEEYYRCVPAFADSICGERITEATINKSENSSSGSSGQGAKGGIDGSTALPIDSSGAKKTGGVDFRGLPIVTQPIPTLQGQPFSGTVPLGRKDNSFGGESPFDRAKEWEQIQRMINAGIVPSVVRIKEYVQACSQPDDIDKVLSCIADILRMEEERCYATEPALKEMLALLESDKSAQELGLFLSGVNVLPKAAVVTAQP